MQSQLTNGSTDSSPEIAYAILVRSVRQDNKAMSIGACRDIAGTSQATSNGLPDSPQARVCRMPAEDFQVSIELFESECH